MPARLGAPACGACAGRGAAAVDVEVGLGALVSSPTKLSRVGLLVGSGASGGSAGTRTHEAQRRHRASDVYVPSWRYAEASSPRAEDVSFARRSPPRARIAFLRASALAAADDMA